MYLLLVRIALMEYMIFAVFVIGDRRIYQQRYFVIAFGIA